MRLFLRADDHSSSPWGIGTPTFATQNVQMTQFSLFFHLDQSSKIIFLKNWIEREKLVILGKLGVTKEQIFQVFVVVVKTCTGMIDLMA